MRPSQFTLSVIMAAVTASASQMPFVGRADCLDLQFDAAAARCGSQLNIPANANDAVVVTSMPESAPKAEETLIKLPSQQPQRPRKKRVYNHERRTAAKENTEKKEKGLTARQVVGAVAVAVLVAVV